MSGDEIEKQNNGRQVVLVRAVISDITTVILLCQDQGSVQNHADAFKIDRIR